MFELMAASMSPDKDFIASQFSSIHFLFNFTCKIRISLILNFQNVQLFFFSFQDFNRMRFNFVSLRTNVRNAMTYLHFVIWNQWENYLTADQIMEECLEVIYQ